MRQLTDHELPLVAHLAALGGLSLDAARLRVMSMDDGGMGSLRFASTESARFGESVAEVTFEDEDGVPVSAALYVDRVGAPFELDVWKVDFTSLRRWPLAGDLTGGSPPAPRLQLA